ncbi:hypothetical protein KY285_035204 [Solanum tuberosum]|nr:hypothetical protein KY285_035204 [Solanum tuberosum]
MEIVPPRAILAIGAILNFFGYFMIWLGVMGRISKPHVWQMCLYICIGANSQSFANTGGTVTCVKNFPANRGIVLGLLKGAVGLSGAIMTQLYLGFYGDKKGESLILLVAWLPVLVSCIFLPSIRIMKVIQQENDVKMFFNLLFVSLGLAIFLLIMIIIQKKFTFNRVEYVLSGVVVLVLIFSPLVLVIREEFNIWKSKQGLVSSDISQLNASIQVENPPSSKTNWSLCFKSAFNPPERGEDHTILQAFFNIDMLILFVATTFGVGGTLTSIDNLGQIGKALGYPDSSISTFVSLVSIWNYLGRVSSGFASEILLSKYNFPRPLMLTLVLLLSCIGHLLIAFGIRNSLYVSSVLMGFCFGAQWPLILSIISELFGLKYYATLYNFGSVASPIGGYILNVRVAGHLYDKEALKQLEAKGIFTRKIGEDLNCVGVIRIYLQEEIMMEILIRLPVRSLLRFKCVWKSLIDDPYFRRTHYIHNKDDQNSQKLLTMERLFMKDEVFNFYTCSLSMLEDKQKLDWPSSCKPMLARIFCSCNGLVLILVSSGGYYEELVLWNPSTRESILLPHPEFPVRTCVCGLEYDATSEDYKILAINLNAADSFYTSIQLLSLKSGSWRIIGYPTGIKPKLVRGFRDCGMDYLAFLPGAFHWLGMSHSGYYTTVSFNISNEVYGEVPLLEQMFGVSPHYIIDHGVSVLRGMLCFYSTHNHWTEGRIGTFKLWIMKDYGVRESWTKLIEIRDTNLFHSARPKYMFADCEVLLQYKGKRCFNSKFTTSRGPFEFCPKCNITKHGIIYAESFISPNSLT